MFASGKFDEKGWAVGHMAKGPLNTNVIEVKWARQPKGDAGWAWRKCDTGTTLSILIEGKFKMEFRNVPGSHLLHETVIFTECGTYAIFDADVEHRSEALEETLFLTIRWPSTPGNCKELEQQR